MRGGRLATAGGFFADAGGPKKEYMFKRRTLFVLGAGASFEAGLPLGKALAGKIGKKMNVLFEGFNQPKSGDGDFQLFAQLTNNMHQSVNELQQAAWLIRDGIGFSQSIDDFLDQHRTNKWVDLYGKAAIAKTILEAEQESKFYFNSFNGEEMFDVSSVANTWFVKFIYLLGRGVTKEDVRQIFDKVAFIVFNYDRCLEFFLTHALRRLYRIQETEAASIVRDSHIVHPYGAVPDNIPFGTTSVNCAHIAHHIKTYTEQMGAGDVVNAIAAEVSRAQCIVFLGFAYHSPNMSLLRPPTRIAGRPIFGTAIGMSDADVDLVSHDLAGFFSPLMDTRTRARMIQLDKLECAKFFDDYARSLTGGD
jgi:hypothetical protein